MTTVYVALSFETRKCNVELEADVTVALDRPVEGAVKSTVSKMLDQAFSQGFLREPTGPLNIKITQR